MKLTIPTKLDALKLVVALPATVLIRAPLKCAFAVGFPQTHRRANDALISLSRNSRRRLGFIARDSKSRTLVVEIYAYNRFISYLEIKIEEFGRIIERRLGIHYLPDPLPQQKERLDTAMMLCIKDICEDDGFEPNAALTPLKQVLLRKQLAAIATYQFSILLQQLGTFAFNVTQLALRWV